MLGAFLGPAYRDWWLSYIKNPSSITSLQNHWLLSTSAAMSFSRGMVRLDRLPSSMIDVSRGPSCLENTINLIFFSLGYPIPQSLRTLGEVVMTILRPFEIILSRDTRLLMLALLAHTLDSVQVFNASTSQNSLQNSKRHHVPSRGPSAGCLPASELQRSPFPCQQTC